MMSPLRNFTATIITIPGVGFVLRACDKLTRDREVRVRFARYVVAVISGCALGWFGMQGFDAKMVPIIVGTSTATAQLAGIRVAISGTFEGMLTPATTARLYESRIRDTRGEVVGHLAVTRAANWNSEAA